MAEESPDNALQTGTGITVVLLLTAHGDAGFADLVWQKVKEIFPNAEGSLIVYEADDWDRDYSPWISIGENGRNFAGNGRKTLKRIEQLLQAKSNDRIYLAGYSLAGLFALWSLYESELFDGCACCSGSLWFDGWKEYSENHIIKKQSLVYLSLGGREEKTDHPMLSKIGERTREENRYLNKMPMVKKHTLVMNPGGHFASPEKRLAQGIAWLLQEGT